MAVYKRTYKTYDGPRTPEWSRFGVLTRYSFSTLFNSRMFTAYTVACFLPFLVGLGFVYVVHSQMAQTLVGMQLRGTPLVNQLWFSAFLGNEMWMSLILTAW